MPHTGEISHPPASLQSPVGRETTVVRIPLRSAKHHFGAASSRGTRPANEDAYQAGVIDIPAFAKRPPRSLTIRRSPDASADETTTTATATATSGDPQVFYFGVFDGHGGTDCSTFLRDRLHEYVQDTAAQFELQSTLLSAAEQGMQPASKPSRQGHEDAAASKVHAPSILQGANCYRIGRLEKELVTEWRRLVGGYFRRFVPPHFSCLGVPARAQANDKADGSGRGTASGAGVAIEEVMEYAFLRADLDFVSAQALKRDDDDPVQAEKPLNEDDILDHPSQMRTANIGISCGGGGRRFKGGSTCSVALISTPTPTPFWHPSAPASLLVSHVGDTRILLCSTATGEAVPLTSDHHPSSPIEASRLRRYAATFVTDSFGEERMSGLANTRAFGDVQSKRIGVSAEPELRRVELGPAEYSFLVVMSDGISGSLDDQEIVDIIKEAHTPDQGARDVVSFATEVSREGDNATCLVIRLGGWQRRLEGGMGSLGTRESRDWRRQDATDPRRSRR